LTKPDQVVLFLDYDGTLVPISERPAHAVISPSTQNILRDLVRNKKTTVSIISGRVLKQVKGMVGVRGIYYAGCHGLEAEDERFLAHNLEADKTKIIIRDIRSRLIKDLRKEKLLGFVDIEDKGLILGLHYRRVKKIQLDLVKRIFRRTVTPYVISRDIVIGRNKKVLEAGPDIDWDKGRYCKQFLKGIKPSGRIVLPVYIGDDKTDETAFAALRQRGITVFVKGERKTSLAEYYLNSTSEVKKFLRYLTNALN
jgi:trehalose 6-phosphate phosphatase